MQGGAAMSGSLYVAGLVRSVGEYASSVGETVKTRVQESVSSMCWTVVTGTLHG